MEEENEVVEETEPSPKVEEANSTEQPEENKIGLTTKTRYKCRRLINVDILTVDTPSSKKERKKKQE